MHPAMEAKLVLRICFACSVLSFSFESAYVAHAGVIESCHYYGCFCIVHVPAATACC